VINSHEQAGGVYLGQSLATHDNSYACNRGTSGEMESSFTRHIAGLTIGNNVPLRRSFSSALGGKTESNRMVGITAG
jgi:hypothetical protein